MAANVQHTSGPWKANSGATVYVAGDEWETLSSGRTIRKRVAHALGNSIPEVEANARLIAAAPELLAALEMVERRWESTEYHSPTREEMEQVAAAIVKARGYIA